MDRTALADCLRRRRDELQPSDVGLAAGVRRRALFAEDQSQALLGVLGTQSFA